MNTAPNFLEAYDREKLYREVWTEPVRTVALRYGVSDVALTKACRRLKVPVPGVGYWAKKKAGKAPERPALPELSPEEQARLRWTSDYRTQQRTLQQGRPLKAPTTGEDAQPNLDVKVDERLVRPHRLVSEARELLRQPGRRIRFPSFPEKPCLDIDVTRGALSRALRIVDALIKALEAQGYEVKNTAPERKTSSCNQSELVYGVTRVRVGGHWVNFGLSESFTRVEVHVPLDWARAWGGYSIERVREGTGKFSLFVTNAPYGLRRTWNDGKKQRVEDCLGAFVAYLPLIAAGLEQERLEAARRHQLWLEEERRRKDAEARRRAEERRRKELEEALKSWRHAQEIRSFVAAVREAATAQEGEGLQPQVAEKLCWALRYADSVDSIPGFLLPSPDFDEDGD